MSSILHTLNISDTLLKLMLAALIIAAAAVIFSALRCPPWYKVRAARAFQKSGLCINGVCPVLRSVKRDPEKRHGMIFHVRNNGITIPDMENKLESLKLGFEGVIYNMRYTNKARDTLVCVLPWKWASPALLSPNDDAIGASSIKDLINLLVIGPTGTGKSVVIKIILCKIIMFWRKTPTQKNSAHTCAKPTMWILDFKQLDFKFLSGLPRYYGYKDCIQGLNDFYETFKRQQAIGVAGEPHYLVVDEWGSFIMSLEDKKEAEQLKAKLAELIMLGRAYHFYPIVGIQRPDSNYFHTARDNFIACIALGTLSPEARRMVFPDSVTNRITECRKREGHLYIDGVGLEKIRVEDILDISALDNLIKEAMSR